MNEQKTYDVITNFKHYQVTETQVDACERVIDLEKHEVFYQVKSATTPDAVYEVRYHKAYGKLSCTCPAGLWYTTCWHRRAAIVSERLYKEAKQAEREAAKREAAAIEATPEYQREQREASLAQYTAALKEDGSEPAKRELKALKKYGLKAYDNDDGGFKIMK